MRKIFILFVMVLVLLFMVACVSENFEWYPKITIKANLPAGSAPDEIIQYKFCAENSCNPDPNNWVPRAGFSGISTNNTFTIDKGLEGKNIKVAARACEAATTVCSKRTSDWVLKDYTVPSPSGTVQMSAISITVAADKLSANVSYELPVKTGDTVSARLVPMVRENDLDYYVPTAYWPVINIPAATADGVAKVNARIDLSTFRYTQLNVNDNTGARTTSMSGQAQGGGLTDGRTLRVICFNSITSPDGSEVLVEKTITNTALTAPKLGLFKWL